MNSLKKLFVLSIKVPLIGLFSICLLLQKIAGTIPKRAMIIPTQIANTLAPCTVSVNKS